MDTISIVGGGIAGLSSAIALSNLTLNIKIFEKTEYFSKLGAGIQLGPNGTRAISALGVLDEVVRRSSKPENIFVYDISTNKHLCKLSLGYEATKKYGYPYLTILRSDLHSVLKEKVESIANVEIINNCKIKSLEIQKQKISILNHFGKEYHSNALIACDGVHSTIKKLLFKKRKLNHVVSIAYRTLVKNNSKSIKKYSKDINIWFGKSFHVVTYPVGINQDINIVVVSSLFSNNKNYGWSNPCQLNDFYFHFEPFSNVDISKLIKENNEWFMWPIYESKPVSSNTELCHESIMFCGDAGHYMKPHMAQGASMALEDGVHIMKATEHEKNNKILDWKKLFTYISKKRLKRVSKVQKISSRNGYIFQATGIVRVARNYVLKLFGKRILNQKWIYKNGS